MARTPPWMVGVKEAQRERDKAAKATRVYGVVMHSSGDGYVVREGWKRDDGSFGFPSPYGEATPKAVSTSQKLAQRKADALNR